MTGRRTLVIAMAVGSLMPSGTASGQSVGRMIESDLKNFGGDIIAVWMSPFRGSGKDWLIAGATVAVSAASSIADDDVDRWMVRNRNSSGWSALKEVREGGLAFSGKTITPIAIGLFGVGLATKSEGLQDGLFGCLSSYVSGSVVRNQIAYRLVARRRPSPDKSGPETAAAQQDDQYDIELPGKADWGQHSMPAGHAANIIACASFLNHRFSMGPVEPMLYLLSAGVGVGRLVDRRHWTSDTVLGMVFGYAIGKQVATRSLRRAEKRDAKRDAQAGSERTARFYVGPGASSALTAGWTITF